MDTLTSELPLQDAFRPEYLEYYGIFPTGTDGGKLAVAVAGTPAPEALADLERSFGLPLHMIEVERPVLEDAVRRAFVSSDSMHSLVKSLDAEEPIGDGSGELESDARDLANQPPVIRYVNLLIREAHRNRASDIHLESTRQGLNVRLRVDGVLTAAPAPPLQMLKAVVSRVKLISDLDIAERRVPQDGRIRIRLEDRELDLRVSTVPTLFGESVVMRLLDHGGAPVGLESLGMDQPTQAAFGRLARRPHGIVLATGPTGSGKTTTMYSALQLRDATTEKIITVEDPVEYQLQGVTQVPVNNKAGMTFAAGLRSILRQDPDVVMVGEMRDPETARIAVQAAMTGHLVFSTIHTNDAASAVTRMIDLGVEPFLVGATLRGVLAQRLVRRICQGCSESGATPSTDEQVRPLRRRRAAPGEGCEACRHTGYFGRIGLFELLVVDESIRAEVNKAPDASRIKRLALDSGMLPLREDGREKVMAGLTTSEEVLRAIQE